MANTNDLSVFLSNLLSSKLLECASKQIYVKKVNFFQATIDKILFCDKVLAKGEKDMYSRKQKREIRKLYFKCQKTYALSDLMFAFSSAEQNQMEIFEKVNNEASQSFMLNRVNQSNSNSFGSQKFVSLIDCMPTFCKDLQKQRISNLDLWILENIVLPSKNLEQIKRLDAGFKVCEIVKDIKSDLISSVKNDFNYYCKVVYNTNNELELKN